MAHYARINALTHKVEQVVRASSDFISALPDRDFWVQTSYNTTAGQHLDGGTPLRKNFAAIGGVYDTTRDAFYASQPFTSWTLNETTCIWESPVAHPDDGSMYAWNEETQTWDEVS